MKSGDVLTPPVRRQGPVSRAFRAMMWVVAVPLAACTVHAADPEPAPTSEARATPSQNVEAMSTTSKPCETCCNGPRPAPEPCATIVCDPTYQDWEYRARPAGAACVNGSGQSGTCDGASVDCASSECVTALRNMGCLAYVQGSTDAPYGWQCPDNACSPPMYQSCGCAETGAIVCDNHCFPGLM